MRNPLTSHAGRRRAGSLWPLALLALSGCSFQAGRAPNVFPGPLNHISAVFCDIEKKSEPRHCASSDEILIGVPLSHAAVAFLVGDTTSVGLDYSPDAVTRCGGAPEAVPFEGPFPEGTPVCVNCLATIGDFYPDANALCVAQCEDLNGGLSGQNPPDVVAFCEAHAHVSTNAPVDDCFTGACTPGGSLRHDFLDPRRHPEPALWQDLIGVSATLVTEPFGEPISTLTRSAPTSAPPAFDAGAAGTQWITRGDAYVEFAAGETTAAHAAGLSEPTGCVFPCPDTTPGLGDIQFGILLDRGGAVRIAENGTIAGAFGTYAAGDRFRVTVTENNDSAGAATIAYARVLASCAGVACPATVFHTATAPGHYPLRLDTSLREQGATLTPVRVVRIR